MKRYIALLVCALLLVTMMFVSCDDDAPVVDAHQHTFGDVWSMDETNHWHAATCKDGEDCATAKVSVAAHADADKNSLWFSVPYTVSDLLPGSSMWVKASSVKR